MLICELIKQLKKTITNPLPDQFKYSRLCAVKNRMKTILCFFLIHFASSILYSAPAYADQNIIIEVASIDNFTPFSFYADGSKKGIYIEIVQELFSRIEYSYSLKLLPFKRMLEETRDGQIDIMVGVFHTSERKKFSTYLLQSPLTNMTSSLFVLKNGPINSLDLTELKGRNIVSKRGFITSPKFDAAANQGLFHKLEVETVEQLVKILLNQRADGFIHNTWRSLEIIKQFDHNKRIKQIKPPVSDARETYMAISNKSIQNFPRSFFTQLQQAYGSMSEDGTIQRINANYGIPYQFKK